MKRSIIDRKEFLKQNQEERDSFVQRWAEFVRNNNDKIWSRQQNKIIDSTLKTSNITKEEYLKMKKKRP